MESGYAAPIAFMGAPTVLIEKLFNGKEFVNGIKNMESMMKVIINQMKTETIN